ncbi:MAG: hypothetical protein IT548_05025 [Alphaproteobacteria bacterium]|nr:hypothetical protein [Alphaproteobacteria bacterium]
MKSLIVAAVATFALGGAALAGPAPSGNWSTGTMSKVTPVAAETCATAKASYHAALKSHPKSAALKDAKAKARAAAASCASGRSADGIAGYDAATKLLGA